jgi:hypothetical protein
VKRHYESIVTRRKRDVTQFLLLRNELLAAKFMKNHHGLQIYSLTFARSVRVQ